jgi:hypothetical protein
VYGPRLFQPIFWPQLLTILGHRLFLRESGRRRRIAARESERRAARAWCAARAVDTGAALRALGIPSPDLTPLPERFPRVFREAGERVRAVPVDLMGGGNLELLYELARHLGATRVVETGVAYGWSSLALLLALRDRPGARLHSTDLPFLALHNDRWVGIAVPQELRPQWTLYRQPDRRGLPRALARLKSIDLAHYDSDKSAAGRRWAFARLWPALRPGGVFVADDVNDNFAFRDQCEGLGARPLVVGYRNKYQGILLKG